MWIELLNWMRREHDPAGSLGIDYAQPQAHLKLTSHAGIDPSVWDIATPPRPHEVTGLIEHDPGRWGVKFCLACQWGFIARDDGTYVIDI